MSAVTQSECRGKSRLTFLASGKKKQLHFMPTFCSANQGAEETVCLGKLFYFLLFRLGLVCPIDTWSKSIRPQFRVRKKGKGPPCQIRFRERSWQNVWMAEEGIWGGAGYGVRGTHLSNLRRKEVNRHLCKEFFS